MARSLYLSASLLPLSVVVLSLAACQSAPPANQAPVVTTPVHDVAPYGGLEQRVQNLENQMRDAQPTLRKVDAMETHFKALSFELDQISKNYKMNEVHTSVAGPLVQDVPKESPKEVTAPKPVAKAEVKKVEPKKVATAPAVSSDVFAVTSVRVGEQGKVTRIVLDTTQAAEIRYDLDNAEGLLVIDIPKAKWSTTEEKTIAKSPMVRAFKAVADSNGSHFVAELKQKAKVVATARLNPSGTSGHRVYVDLAPAE